MRSRKSGVLGSVRDLRNTFSDRRRPAADTSVAVRFGNFVHGMKTRLVTAGQGVVTTT